MYVVIAAVKPLEYESKPVISDFMKCSDIGVDMDGEGFKPHKPGVPDKENSQVCVVLMQSLR